MKRGIFFDESNGKASVVKEKNYFLKKKLLKLIYKQKKLSVSSIKQELNISAPSVHKLLDGLVEERVLQELGIGDSVGGRRPNMYGYNPNSFYILVIEINYVSIRMGLMNPLDEFLSLPEEFFVDLEDSEEYGKQLFEKIKRFVTRSGIESYKVLGVGVSAPGLVDSRLGKSFDSLSFSKEGLAKWLQGYIGIPVFIENDSRIMALAEYNYGDALEMNNVLCVNFTERIGLGMILNGELYEGNSGLAGEFGHIQVKEDGKTCSCGKKGCLETVASEKVLLDNARKAWDNGGFSALRNMVSNINTITISSIIDAANSDDEKAIELIADVGKNIGIGLAVLLHLLNPKKIIIGGSIAGAGRFILDPIWQSINKCTINRIANDTEIITSNIKENVFLKGAYFLAMKNIFADTE